MSVFSLSGRLANPSAYNCTTAASSTRSSRYLRSVAAEPDAAAGAPLAGAAALLPAADGPPPHDTAPNLPLPLPHASVPTTVIDSMILFIRDSQRSLPHDVLGSLTTSKV